MPEKQENKLTGWDITISKKQQNDVKIIKELLNKFCTSWVFQEEKGEKTGYEHWQCRVYVKNRLRPTCRKFPFEGHWSPTCNNVHLNNNFNYCMKEDTRIDGPWRSSDPTTTKQLDDFLEMELRPYQKEISNWANEFDMRWIDVIYDTEGNLGKSIFTEYLEYIGAAEEVPPYRSMEDIMQWVAGRPIKPMYIFDMPRGMKKDKLAEFYSGIEVIKNGVAFDKRYTPTKVRFNRPRIVIFTNTMPCLGLMSKDRWRIWKSNEKYEIRELSDNDIQDELNAAIA